MLTPKDYIGALMELGQDRRGIFKEMNFVTQDRASIIYELPLAEVLIRNALTFIRERPSIT
jgi:translation factor GUF1, mitochondrial